MRSELIVRGDNRESYPYCFAYIGVFYFMSERFLEEFKSRGGVRDKIAKPMVVSGSMDNFQPDICISLLPSMRFYLI